MHTFNLVLPSSMEEEIVVSVWLPVPPSLHSKKKIHDFLAVLTGFEKSVDIVEAFSSCVSGFK